MPQRRERFELSRLYADRFNNRVRVETHQGDEIAFEGRGEVNGGRVIKILSQPCCEVEAFPPTIDERSLRPAQGCAACRAA